MIYDSDREKTTFPRNEYQLTQQQLILIDSESFRLQVRKQIEGFFGRFNNEKRADPTVRNRRRSTTLCAPRPTVMYFRRDLVLQWPMSGTCMKNSKATP